MMYSVQWRHYAFLPQNVFTSIVLSSGYSGADGAVLESVKAFGFQVRPTNVRLNTTAIGPDNVTYSNRVSLFSMPSLCKISLLFVHSRCLRYESQ